MDKFYTSFKFSLNYSIYEKIIFLFNYLQLQLPICIICNPTRIISFFNYKVSGGCYYLYFIFIHRGSFY